MIAPEPDEIAAFYERHPYPPPVPDLDAFADRWSSPQRRTGEFHRFFPNASNRDELDVLVAGCGTTQAARQAIKWPGASIVGIDVSDSSLAETERLRDRHELRNLELRNLAIEHVAELGRSFDLIVCTGVIHHLADPVAGLSALHDVLRPNGAMHLMVYGRHGRAGIAMLREYCALLGVSPVEGQVDELVETLREVPMDHPISRVLRGSPDFRTNEAVADALLNPREQTYSVGELMELLADARFAFGRWYRQAPYRPQCGALATTPHATRLAALPLEHQFAAAELFRGTMTSHSVVAHRNDSGVSHSADQVSGGDVPIRLADTIAVTEKVPEGYSAVLINQTHKDTDLVLGVGDFEMGVLSAIDGRRSVDDVLLAADATDETSRRTALTFIERLWLWDQIVLDQSRR